MTTKALRRFDRLVSFYLDMTISDIEMQELNELLAHDPQCARRFLEITAIHAALSQSHTRQSSATDTQPGTFRLNKGKARTAAKRRISLPNICLRAAALLALTAAGLYVFRQKAEVPRPIAKLTGSASVTRYQDVAESTDSPALFPGDTVVTRQSTTGTISFADGTSIMVFPDSSLTLSRDRRRKILSLVHGSVKCNVSKQPTRLPLTISTPQAQITILGTIFHLASTNSETILSVTRGKVQMRDWRTKQAIVVTSGFSARATSKNPPQFINSVSPRDWRPLDPTSFAYHGSGKWKSESLPNSTAIGYTSPLSVPANETPTSSLVFSSAAELVKEIKGTFTVTSIQKPTQGSTQTWGIGISPGHGIALRLHNETKTHNSEQTTKSFAIVVLNSNDLEGRHWDEAYPSRDWDKLTPVQPFTAYNFRVNSIALPDNKIQIRCKVWKNQSPEPEEWQISRILPAPNMLLQPSFHAFSCDVEFMSIVKQ